MDLDGRNQRARARHGRRLGRDDEAQALIERGWPHLRILENKKGSAKKALEAIDPHTGPRWSKEAAVGFVDGFCGGELRKLVERSFESVLGYPFAHADALWIFEALLGADTVAGEFAAAFSTAPPQVWTWDNPHQRMIAQLTALGWVLLRAGAKPRADCLSAIADAQARAGRGTTPLHRAVDFLLVNAEPDLEDEEERRQRVVHESVALARGRMAHPWRLWICDPQDLWVTGVAPPVHSLPSLVREPRWFKAHLLREWEPFDCDFTTALATQELPKKLSKKELDVAIGELFARLPRELKAVRGKHDKEAEFFGAAALELVTLLARAGDAMPDAHVGQILLVDGWSKKLPKPLDPTPEETGRWLLAIAHFLGIV